MKHLSTKFTALLASAALLFSAYTATAATNNFSNSQKTEIEKIVRNYLLQHPEVLVEVSKVLQQRATAHVTENAKKAIPQFATQLFDAPKSQVAGNAKGNVTIVEFFDYQCGYCKQASPLVKRMIDQDSNLRVVFKEFPIFGKESEFAARAVLAAQAQNKYVELHEALMQVQSKLSEDLILEKAKSVGIDTDRLQRDMDAPEVIKQLDENMKLAEALGLMGTPAFIIASYPVSKDMKYFFVPGVPSEPMLKNYIQSARKS